MHHGKTVWYRLRGTSSHCSQFSTVGTAWAGSAGSAVSCGVKPTLALALYTMCLVSRCPSVGVNTVANANDLSYVPSAILKFARAHGSLLANPVSSRTARIGGASSANWTVATCWRAWALPAASLALADTITVAWEVI